MINLTKEKIADFIFILLLISLPYSEYLIIGLPIKGRPFRIDFNGLGSISIYDLCFTAFVILCIPHVIEYFKKKDFKSIYLLFWLPLIALTLLLAYECKPEFPYLSQLGPIVFRNFLAAVLFVAFVGVYLRTKTLKKIFSGLLKYYIFLSIGFGFLSYMAIRQFDYFELHYPHQAGYYVCYPFSTQNSTGLFISLCAIGLVGVAIAGKQKLPMLFSLPVLVLSLSLTGSRSSFFLCFVALLGFTIIYGVFYFYVWKRNKNAYINPAYILAGVLIGLSLMYCFGNNSPSIQKSWSIINKIASNPRIMYEDERGYTRYYAWKIVSHKLLHKKGEIEFNKNIEDNFDMLQEATEILHRGATHNSYLDFFWAVGNHAGILYVVFILSLNVLFGYFTLKHFNARSFPFIFSIFLQLLILSALQYFHPFWRDKYIWITIGLASAIMTHPELNIYKTDNAAVRLASPGKE